MQTARQPGAMMAALMTALLPFEQAWQRRHEPPPTGAVLTLNHNVPVELIHAAGLQAWRVFPDKEPTSALTDEVMEPVFDGAIRSLFGQCTAGRWATAALAVIPRSSEGHLQLYYFLQETQRLRPELQMPPLHLFDLLKTPNWATRGYVREQLVILRDALQTLSGRLIDESALAQAWALCQRQRRLLAQVNALRRGGTPRLAGSRMLRIIAAGGVMSPQQHIAAMEDLLAEAHQMPSLAGPRVMVKGSTQDDTALYELIESLGAVVVADDHLGGERSFDHGLDEAASTLDSLAQHYHHHSPSARTLPQAAEDQCSLAIARDAAVQGVVFVIEQHDDTLGWDYPAQKRLFEARGLPTLLLVHQPYRNPDAAAQLAKQSAALAPWLASLSAQEPA